MMRIFLCKLAGDRRGTAAVEFALWACLFFVTALAAMDFGAFYMDRGKANEAVAAAALSSFKSRDNVRFDQLTSYVRAVAGDDALSVSVGCNGVNGSCTNFERTCACLGTQGNFVPATCGAACPTSGMSAGSTAGYYLTISATRPYQPMILPRGALTDADVAQSATVRLQ